MVMEYSIPSGKTWVGAQIPVIKNAEKQDLTDAESITFKIKSQDIINSANTKLYLQIGSISEDLDSDNKLDRESSVYSDGFPFNDSSNNAVLLIGGGGNNSQGNSYLDTEDNDLNDILDKEDDDNIVTEDVTGADLSTEYSSWKLVRHVFTTSQKKQLSNSSYVRFVVIKESGTDSAGKLIIGEINVESSPFKVTAGNDDENDITYAREIFERNSDYYPPEKLVDAYPEVKDIFFQNMVPENEQKVLEVQWEDGSIQI